MLMSFQCLLASMVVDDKSVNNFTHDSLSNELLSCRSVFGVDSLSTAGLSVHLFEFILIVCELLRYAKVFIQCEEDWTIIS